MSSSLEILSLAREFLWRISEAEVIALTQNIDI